MQTMMAMTITAAAIWRREGWRREVWGVRERKGRGRQLCGGTGFVVYNNQIVKRTE